jgi:hypothetical protein
MLGIVREIMNPQLFSVSPGEPVERIKSAILGLSITAAPVLDPDRRPIGVLSLRDLLDDLRAGDRVEERMTAPAVTIEQDARVVDVARKLSQSGLRHLVVVDGDGAAVGMVSSGDVLRAMLGRPPRHPAAFPAEPPLSLDWSAPAPFDLDSILTIAPAEPGLLVLTLGGEGTAQRIFWAEAAENVRSRLLDMLAMPLDLDPRLQSWLDRELLHVRFSAARAPDPDQREAGLKMLRGPAPPA